MTGIIIAFVVFAVLRLFIVFVFVIANFIVVIIIIIIIIVAVIVVIILRWTATTVLVLLDFVLVFVLLLLLRHVVVVVVVFRVHRFVVQNHFAEAVVSASAVISVPEVNGRKGIEVFESAYHASA